MSMNAFEIITDADENFVQKFVVSFDYKYDHLVISNLYDKDSIKVGIINLLQETDVDNLIDILQRSKKEFRHQ